MIKRERERERERERKRERVRERKRERKRERERKGVRKKRIRKNCEELTLKDSFEQQKNGKNSPVFTKNPIKKVKFKKHSRTNDKKIELLQRKTNCHFNLLKGLHTREHEPISVARIVLESQAAWCRLETFKATKQGTRHGFGT